MAKTNLYKKRVKLYIDHVYNNKENLELQHSINLINKLEKIYNFLKEEERKKYDAIKNYINDQSYDMNLFKNK